MFLILFIISISFSNSSNVCDFFSFKIFDKLLSFDDFFIFPWLFVLESYRLTEKKFDFFSVFVDG